MFEKEAETKYCKGCKLRMEQCLWAWRKVNWLNEPNEKNCSCKEVPAYIAGAELGYNKANEWHYVKDGDLPTDDKDMFMSGHLILLTKLKGTDDLYVTLGRYNFSTQEFCYQHIVGLIDVVAWQEIVLPKEKE